MYLIRGFHKFIIFLFLDTARTLAEKYLEFYFMRGQVYILYVNYVPKYIIYEITDQNLSNL